MTSFVVSTTVRRPIEVGVAALLDPENFVFWTTHLERFEVVSGVPGEVGAVGRLHYVENGRRYVMEDQLVVAEPGRRYVSRVSGDVIEAMVETRLSAVEGGTRVTIRWSGRGKVFPLRLILPFLRGKMTRQAQGELETLRKLIEARGARFDSAAPPPRSG